VYTKTEIANEALLLLGEDAVANVETSTTDPARAINATWDFTAREVINEFPWRDLVHEAELAVHPDDTLNEEKRYQLPGDCLRLLHVGDPDELAVQYRTEEGFIILPAGTTIESLFVRYLIDKTDPGEWPHDLATCMAYKLAAKIATRLTGDSRGKAADILARYNRDILPDAQFRQSIDTHTESYRPETSSLRASRGPRFYP
jgi:hypothetical protein